MTHSPPPRIHQAVVPHTNMEEHKNHIKNLLISKHGIDRIIADKVLDIFDIYNFKKDRNIFKESETNRYFGIICKGVIKLSVLESNGNENILFFAIEEEIITGNLTPNMKCEFTATTLTPVVILLADYKAFNKLISEDATLLRFHEEIINKIHSKVKGKISKDFFNNSVNNYKKFLKDYPNLLNRIPHYNIASYLGITPTQLSRIRKEIMR